MGRIKIYENVESEFQIVDFSPTHSQLLLRSMKSGERAYNIDIILKGVSHLMIPSTIKGIKISVLDDKDKVNWLKEQFEFQDAYDHRIFMFKDSNNREYFINAFCFGIYHNQLEILETSIGRYDMENHGEMEMWYAD
jgi:hypothetical protein